jgi:phosphoglycerate dehydrogenase-like enzyme
MIRAIFLLSAREFPKLYCPETLARLRRNPVTLGAFIPTEEWRKHRAALEEAEVIFSGWSAPVMDAEFLAATPRLKIVFYAAGSVRYFTTEAFWDRDIRLTTAHKLNAIPVSEYAASVLLLGLKRFWHFARDVRENRRYSYNTDVVGGYRSTVGLISYGCIARLTRRRLLDTDVHVLVHDPLLTREEAERERVQLASLDEIFATADAVSLHAPLLESTIGMITGRHFAQMKTGAVFVNTARGEIVNEAEMIAVLRSRPDLQAILDVTAPEPPLPSSPLYALPNVVLTPHIAGSLGRECRRMGDAMVDEFERYLRGDPLRWEITRESAAVLA